MAFKKTTEGRVFFQGSGNGSSANDGRNNPKSVAPRQPVDTRPEPGSAHQGPTQLQILALLRSLNEKLKATQVERNTMRAELENYRHAMDNLQTKANRGERAEQMAKETMKELEETRKLLLDLEERQSGIEKEGKANSEKIRVGAGTYRDLAKRLQTSEQKQEEIVRKVEETGAQQAKIMRQIEKAIEDRTRFMRKIERIEETVVQTRDALNAKAMVLLTGQNVAGSVSADIDDVFRAQEPGIPDRNSRYGIGARLMEQCARPSGCRDSASCCRRCSGRLGRQRNPSTWNRRRAGISGRRNCAARHRRNQFNRTGRCHRRQMACQRRHQRFLWNRTNGKPARRHYGSRSV
jgi:hypothetical protein